MVAALALPPRGEGCALATAPRLPGLGHAPALVGIEEGRQRRSRGPEGTKEWTAAPRSA